jgi:hypothetical protein
MISTSSAVRRRVHGGSLGLLALFLASAVWADGQTKVTLNANDKAIRAVVAELARQAKVQVRLQAGVRGTVNTDVAAVPFERALTVVVGALGYSWRRLDGVYVVGRFGTAGEQPVTVVVPLKTADPTALARAFGWLDLSCLAGTAPAVVDLRGLLVPGLAGPPVPLPEKRALQVSGQAQSVAEFKQLLTDLDRRQARVAWRYLVAKVSTQVVDTLPVSWAQGPMNFGRGSDGRETLYACGDYDALHKKLSAGGEGVTVLTKGTLAGRDLEILTATAAGCALRIAARSESGLSLKVWMDTTVALGEQSVRLAAEAAKLPPEEGIAMVSRAKPTTPGPEPVLLLLVPTVTTGEG